MHLSNHIGLSVTYQTQILNPDGSIAKSNPPKKNLILDSGLDMLGEQERIIECFSRAVVGTGTTPTNRDSASTTFTRSGTTVTANANFFEAADVGRLLKFDSGEEMYITAYTSVTEVTVDTSGALSASEGTVWYVNETDHQTESKRTSTYGSESGDNGTSLSGAVITHKRTFIFSAEAGSVTYREIGWSNSSTVGADLFGRDIISGGGDSLAAGQQYKVIFNLQMTLSPVNPTAVSDVGNNGFDTSGNACFEYLFNGFSRIATNGGTQAGENNQAEPATTFSRCYARTDAFTQLSGVVFTGGDTSGDFITLSNGAYSAGTFERTKTGTFATTAANASLTGLQLGSSRAFTVKFTSAQTKDSDHTLGVTWKTSWGRTLTN